MNPNINPMQIAQLASLIVGTANVSEQNIDLANGLLNAALEEIKRQVKVTSLASNGIHLQ